MEMKNKEELPAELWVNPDSKYSEDDCYNAREVLINPFDVKYIRADLCEGNNEEALEAWNSVREEFFSMATDADANQVFCIDYDAKFKTIRQALTKVDDINVVNPSDVLEILWDMVVALRTIADPRDCYGYQIPLGQPDLVEQLKKHAGETLTKHEKAIEDIKTKIGSL